MTTSNNELKDLQKKIRKEKLDSKVNFGKMVFAYPLRGITLIIWKIMRALKLFCGIPLFAILFVSNILSGRQVNFPFLFACVALCVMLTLLFRYLDDVTELWYLHYDNRYRTSKENMEANIALAEKTKNIHDNGGMQSFIDEYKKNSNFVERE